MRKSKDQQLAEETELVERALEIVAYYNRDLGNGAADDGLHNLDRMFRKVININFRIVFQPKLKNVGVMFKRVRFGVGAGQLEKYIGQNNAFKAAVSAYDAGGDKYSFKHRTLGTVDFYSK